MEMKTQEIEGKTDEQLKWSRVYVPHWFVDRSIGNCFSWKTEGKGNHKLVELLIVPIRQTEKAVRCLVDAELNGGRRTSFSTTGKWITKSLIFDADRMILCHSCNKPVEAIGFGTHEVSCPVCGEYFGCDD